MSVEKNLLFAVLAFEDELIDLQQLTAACRAWAVNKSKPLADLLVERGWVSAEDRGFLEKKAERKLAKHQNDPRVTLNAATRGDICDALLKEVDDSDVRQSLSSWPSAAPILVETLEDTGQSPPRYTWISQVGAGGLGQVWLAKDNNLSRAVAVKEIKPGSVSDEAVRRLIKEAQITGQLQHPGIVPVYEVNHEGRPFYTMKLVKGQTLSKAIGEHHETKLAGKEDPLAERRLINIFLNVCDAIAYAHSRGVIHRDLKPENIVLGEYGEAIVLDWGLARQVNSDDEDTAPIVVTKEARTDATQAGQKMGTPAYMAPEQASGRVEHMDERTDIYGLGAILFEILSGEPPHRVQKDADPAASSTRVGGPRPSPVATMLHRIATGETPRLRSIDQKIPNELDSICATAMTKHRDGRFQTVKEFKIALLEFQVHEESIDLATRAAADLAKARQTQSYDDFARARFGYEEAVEKWPTNHAAVAGCLQVRLHFALCAQTKGDFDLGLSLLDSTELLHEPLHRELSAARQTMLAQEQMLAEQKQARARLRRILTVTAVSTLIIIAGLGLYSEIQRRDAVVQRGIAVDNAKTAEGRRLEAEKEKEKAQAAKLLAEESQRHAVRELTRAERLLYSSQITSASLKWINGNAALAWNYLNETQSELRGWEHQYLTSLFNQNQTTFHGHTSIVANVAFDPAGTRIVSASWDKTLRLWNATTGQGIATLRGHTNEVTSVAFSPDGKQIVSGSNDDTVKLWDATSCEETLTFHGHTDNVTSVAFSSDGKRILSGSADESVKLWDSTTAAELLTFHGHTDNVTSVGFSSDGKRIISGSADESVKLWDATSGEETLTFHGHTDNVTSVAFSSDGKQIVSASLDKTLKLWNATTGQEMATLRGHTNEVTSVAFSPDGTRVLSGSRNNSGSEDSSLKLWDATTGQTILTLYGHTDGVMCVAFSPDGTWMVSGSVDDTVKLWDATTPQEPRTLRGHSGIVSCLAFSPDGTHVVSASAAVRVWDVRTGEETLSFRGHAEFVTSVAYSPSGQQIVSGSNDNTVKLWDATTGKETLTFHGHTDNVTSVAFSSDGKRILSGSADESVKLWDATTGEELLTFHGHADNVASVAFSSDGLRIVSASWDRTVRLWDATTGQEALKILVPSSIPTNVAFSPDGLQIGCGRLGGTLKLWNAVTGKEILKPHGNTNSDSDYSVAFSFDGTRIVTGSWSAALTLRDAMTGQEILTLYGHDGPVSNVAFSPDGARIASVSHDKTVKLWDATRDQETLTLHGHTGLVASVALSPDGTRVASASHDKTLKLWDATTGQEMLTLIGHADKVTSVAFNSDGTQIVSEDSNGTTLIWDSETGHTVDIPILGSVASNSSLDSPLRVFPFGSSVLLIREDLRIAAMARANTQRVARMPKWREENAAKFEATENWFAASFHLQHLSEVKPDDESVAKRLKHAKAMLTSENDAASAASNN